MIEFAFELEHGALRAAPAPPRRVPLYERNPLRFWQVVALLLALVLAAVLASRVLTGASHPSAAPPRVNVPPAGAVAWGFPVAPLLCKPVAVREVKCRAGGDANLAQDFDGNASSGTPLTSIAGAGT
jgi:hypothetical protein